MGIEIAPKDQSFKRKRKNKDLCLNYLKKISDIKRDLEKGGLSPEKKGRLCEIQRRYMKRYLELLRIDS